MAAESPFDGPGTDAPSGPILTIGYGNERSSEQFVECLRAHAIRFLVDVRSKPFSKFRPEFSKDGLEAILRRAGLDYVFMGDCLGGLPEDPACFTDGKVDYVKVREREWFGRGLDRLEGAWRAGRRFALMCAELEPERCHRSKLIGEALALRGIPVEHIDASGGLVAHRAVMDRLDGGQGMLFDVGRTSRRRYGPKAEGAAE